MFFRALTGAATSCWSAGLWSTLKNATVLPASCRRTQTLLLIPQEKVSRRGSCYSQLLLVCRRGAETRRFCTRNSGFWNCVAFQFSFESRFISTGSGAQGDCAAYQVSNGSRRSKTLEFGLEQIEVCGLGKASSPMHLRSHERRYRFVEMVFLQMHLLYVAKWALP